MSLENSSLRQPNPENMQLLEAAEAAERHFFSERIIKNELSPEPQSPSLFIQGFLAGVTFANLAKLRSVADELRQSSRAKAA